MKTRVDAIQQMFTRKWVVKINDQTFHSRAGGARRYLSSDAALAAGIREAGRRGLKVGPTSVKPIVERGE